MWVWVCGEWVHALPNEVTPSSSRKAKIIRSAIYYHHISRSYNITGEQMDEMLGSVTPLIRCIQEVTQERTPTPVLLQLKRKLSMQAFYEVLTSRYFDFFTLCLALEWIDSTDYWVYSSTNTFIEVFGIRSYAFPRRGKWESIKYSPLQWIDVCGSSYVWEHGFWKWSISSSGVQSMAMDFKYFSVR